MTAHKVLQTGPKNSKPTKMVTDVRMRTLTKTQTMIMMVFSTNLMNAREVKQVGSPHKTTTEMVTVVATITRTTIMTMTV